MIIFCLLVHTNAMLDIIILGTIFVLREIKSEEAAVLHYTYAKFSDLTSRRDRCGCKPTKEDVKRCFMLEFDRSVSLVPSVILVFFIYLDIFTTAIHEL